MGSCKNFGGHWVRCQAYLIDVPVVNLGPSVALLNRLFCEIRHIRVRFEDWISTLSKPIYWLLVVSMARYEAMLSILK